MAETFTPQAGKRAAETPGADAAGPKPAGRIVIKKYANRRLYNTGSSSYVTLDHLSDMVKEGVDFVVFDAKTSEDITRQVLTQIIFEAENSGQNLLPIQFLRQLIQLYGAQMQSLVPGYLEMSLDAFAKQQDSMRDRLGSGPLTGAQPYRLFEEQIRQNMALFGQAMKMLSPFAFPRAEESQARAASSNPKSETPAAPADELTEMKSRIEEMQRQIARLAEKG